jgi:FkbM family methyltransferase
VNVLRVLKARSGIGNRLSTSRGAQAIIKGARRARTVRQPLRIAILELISPRGRAHAHEIDGGHVVIRHRTRDIEIFDEIYVGPHEYEPPSEVVHILASVSDLRVLDLGGNIGLFGAWFLARYPDSTVTSVEPDPQNLPVLRRCVSLHDAHRWTVVEACAGTSQGSAQFASGNYADSYVTDGGSNGQPTISVPVMDVLPLLRETDFVKMDIEGSEWPVLLDDRLPSMTARVIVIEWHQRGCPEPNGYDLAHNALTAAGFTLRGDRPEIPHHGMLWGWRE